MVMRLKYKGILLLVSLCLFLVGCRHEEVEEQAHMKLSICLPERDAIQAGGPRRVMGDPGTFESFALPRYAYVFIMRQVGDTWSVWKREECTLNDDSWDTIRYHGRWDTEDDYIYHYKGDMQYTLRKDNPKGRIYAICSNVQLTFNRSLESITNLDDLMNLKFNTAPVSIQENLQNIYSTPYNYAPDGEYYCSYDCSQGNSFHVDMLMYHVASKVDIKWNVADSMRINKTDPSQAVRLTYMEARRLFNDYAYCFMPMRNVLPSLPGSGEGYDIPNIVTSSDEGLWWEGRSYFYTIPYIVSGAPNHFPLQMLMGTNGTTPEYELTLKKQIDTTDVFVPWLRGDFKLSQPLGTEQVTKTVN